MPDTSDNKTGRTGGVDDGSEALLGDSGPASAVWCSSSSGVSGLSFCACGGPAFLSSCWGSGGADELLDIPRTGTMLSTLMSASSSSLAMTAIRTISLLLDACEAFMPGLASLATRSGRQVLPVEITDAGTVAGASSSLSVSVEMASLCVGSGGGDDGGSGLSSLSAWASGLSRASTPPSIALVFSGCASSLCTAVMGTGDKLPLR